MSDPGAPDAAGALLVADSFRVRERAGTSEVRALPLHLARFRAEVERAALVSGAQPESLGLEAFFDRAITEIAVGGAGFPRLELRGGGGDDSGDLSSPGSLRLRVAFRKLPALTETLSLTSVHTDPAPNARVKGPNIERYAALNQRAGTESLLLDTDGSVREGATTSIVAWDHGALVVSSHGDRVASVCERLVVERARDLGITVVRRRMDVSELPDREVWAVNALHGIRQVTAIDGAPQPTDCDDTRLSAFRAGLDDAWAPVRAGHVPGQLSG